MWGCGKGLPRGKEPTLGDCWWGTCGIAARRLDLLPCCPAACPLLPALLPAHYCLPRCLPPLPALQVVPHITDAIQDWVERVAHTPVDGRDGVPDVCVIELGGTVGDIESMPFIEALRQFQFRVGAGARRGRLAGSWLAGGWLGIAGWRLPQAVQQRRRLQRAVRLLPIIGGAALQAQGRRGVRGSRRSVLAANQAGRLNAAPPALAPRVMPSPPACPAGNFCCVHVSLVPVIGVVGEQKTKPTQHSVATLRSLGLNPTLLACRSSERLQDSVREKLVRRGAGLGGMAALEAAGRKYLYGCWACGCVERLVAGQLSSAIIVEVAPYPDSWLPPRFHPPIPPWLQASFCHVPAAQVLTMHDVSNIWRVPLMMQAQGAHDTICRILGLGGAPGCDTSMWRQRIADKWDQLTQVGGRGGVAAWAGGLAVVGGRG